MRSGRISTTSITNVDPTSAVEETAPAISIVIPCFNEAPNIAGALQAILAQDSDERCEVLVVDSSSDGTADIVTRDFPGVRLIQSTARLSAGGARNRGLEEVRGSKILFTDADVRVPSDWVRRFSKHLDAVEFAGGAIGNGTPWSLSGSSLYLLEFFRLLPGRAMTRPRDARFAATANIGYRREVLTDRSFVAANAGEDVVFHHELADAGASSRFDPTLVVLHLNRCGWRRVGAKQLDLGAGGYRWRVGSGRATSLGVRVPPVMLLKPFAVVGALFMGSLWAARWLRALTVLVISPVLLALDTLWVVGYLRAASEAKDRGDALGDGGCTEDGVRAAGAQ